MKMFCTVIIEANDDDELLEVHEQLIECCIDIANASPTAHIEVSSTLKPMDEMPEKEN
jgi:hypothetical protein